MLAVLHQPKA